MSSEQSARDEYLASLDQVYALSLEVTTQSGHVHWAIRKCYENVRQGLLHRAALEKRCEDLENALAELSSKLPLKEPVPEEPRKIIKFEGSNLED